MMPYSPDYWRQVERSHTPRTRRHLELGLDGTHQLARVQEPWWLETHWPHALFFCLFVALLVGGILFAGGRLELGS